MPDCKYAALVASAGKDPARRSASSQLFDMYADAQFKITSFFAVSVNAVFVLMVSGRRVILSWGLDVVGSEVDC